MLLVQDRHALASFVQLLNIFVPACTYTFRTISEAKIVSNKHFVYVVKNVVPVYICGVLLELNDII